MNCKIEGSNLVLTVPLNPKPYPPSSTGKTRIVATTHGSQPTGVHVDGKPITVSLNAYIKP